MKFEYYKEKFADLGLIVKHGNVQNVVFFWDEQNEAVSYNLEIFRIDWQYKQNGFFKEATIEKRKVEIRDYSVPSGKRVETDKYLVTEMPTEMPAVVSNQFAVWTERQEPYNGVKRSDVTLYKFNKAKPVCTINIERNKFYHSINDLPCGDYIVCLKVENRSGEVYAESTPYYFHIEDAETNADRRAGTIARAATGYVVCN